jgi:succinoglycan biosynthesis protein ExoM
MNAVSAATSVPHIAVCVCTFRRPYLLSCLLRELVRQKTESLFEYSITIVDNDVSQSSKQVVAEFQKTSPLQVAYHVEPEQNIALARNRALANSTGDFVAFIDDDELPRKDWLLRMFLTCVAREVDGVLGPVLPRFETTPPAWVRRGRFCDRPIHNTGFVIGCDEGRTGNLLLRRRILDTLDPVFRPQFGSGGEDRDLFRRLIADGRVFVWCNEAEVYESVPSVRWKRSFMLRRALLRGKTSLNDSRGIRDVARSCSAVIGYTLALPVFLVIGQHVFMKYLIKTCDHAGKLLALAGLDPIREKYVLD